MQAAVRTSKINRSIEISINLTIYLITRVEGLIESKMQPHVYTLSDGMDREMLDASNLLEDE